MAIKGQDFFIDISFTGSPFNQQEIKGQEFLKNERIEIAKRRNHLCSVQVRFEARF